MYVSIHCLKGHYFVFFTEFTDEEIKINNNLAFILESFSYILPHFKKSLNAYKNRVIPDLRIFWVFPGNPVVQTDHNCTINGKSYTLVTLL